MADETNSAKPTEETSGKHAKKRRQWERKGAYKYLLENLRRIHRELREIKITQRYIVKGLGPYLSFSTEYLVDVACSDEVDQEILEVLSSASSAGLLPKDVAFQLEKFHLKPWNVTQRIRRMNKKLDARIGKVLAEKRGLCWAFTGFAEKAWGATKEEMEKGLPF